jgi:hypothetical protein
MFSEKDVSDWAEYLDNIDLPVDYEISLVCFVTYATMAGCILFHLHFYNHCSASKRVVEFCND